MPIPGIAAMIWNRIVDFISEVWSIRIDRSRAIRRRPVGFQEPEMVLSIYGTAQTILDLSIEGLKQWAFHKVGVSLARTIGSNGRTARMITDLVFPFLIVGVSGTSGESSSSKPCLRWDIDLNRPPAAELEPSSSTSDHPKEVVDQALSEAEDRILYRLRPFPQANADKLLMEEARAIAQLEERADCRSNGTIGFRLGPMPFGEKKNAIHFIIGESILTNKQTEYPSHKLSEELCRADAHTPCIYF
ncbi:unnamed protein product [Sphenostylis stenocarpa]|uniref:Uncharacterized protein n=1 Tax=Sphenostylis stenocarpa TaxID=92480 RepID=A0AA86ST70_9FABA|nr:unnamed protein product [Sphenostylis stenocarpa]